MSLYAGDTLNFTSTITSGSSQCAKIYYYGGTVTDYFDTYPTNDTLTTAPTFVAKSSVTPASRVLTAVFFSVPAEQGQHFDISFVAPSLSVSVSSLGNGTASPSSTSVSSGGSSTLTAVPDSGYQFSSWNCTGGGTLSSTTTNPATLSNITAAATCTASFVVISSFNAPGAPSLVTLKSGNKKVQLTWQAPSSDGGSPIAGYEVEYRTGSGGWLAAPRGCSYALTSISSSTFCDLTGLTNASTYSFHVRAINTNGAGNWSDADNGTPNFPGAKRR